MTGSFEARAASHLDEAALYRVCHATSGSPTDDPELLGHVFAGPYLRFEPDLVRVIADERGVAGYVLGCLDTAAFDAELERSWWPELRTRYPLGSGTEGDAWVVRMLHDVGMADPPELLEAFPSHLHIDLLDRAQGTGWGRRLLEWLFEALAERGSPGVHLGVGRDNERAIGFYRRLGFRDTDRPGGTMWLVRELP